MATATAKLADRIGVASLWTSSNPTLLAGERGVESDTKRFKIGDGSTAWTSLEYASSGEHGAEDTVASATTTDIGATVSENVSITGTTTITGLGTCAAGTKRWGRFTGALTLTHDGTALILPGAANITTAAGDRFVAVSLGSGNWCVHSYTKANGEAVVGGSGGTGQTFLTRPVSRRVVYNTAVVTLGLNNSITGTAAGQGASTTALRCIRYTSAATTNSYAGWRSDQTQVFPRNGSSFRAVIRVPTPSDTTQRFWVGVSTGSATLRGADDPAIKAAAFRFSTTASDVNWQAFTNDGSGGGTITDTGIAVSTSLVALAIEFLTGSVKFYINGTLVATHSTNLPDADMYYIAEVVTLSDAARAIECAEVSAEDLL